MSALSDVFELSVIISAVDKWTSPMKSMMSSMKYSQQGIDAITKSMKNIGMSSAEIDKVSASMDKFARNQSWSKIAQDMKNAGISQQQIDQMAAGYEKLADQQERLEASMKTAMVGAGITVFGVGLTDMLAKAAEKAGELQQAVVGVGSSMKLSNTQMQQFGNLAMTLGIPTKFSAVQTSGLLQAMYTAGLPKSQIFNPDVSQQYINFADIQEYMKHENGTDVVSNAVGMAHQYQLYSASQISPFLNDLNAILVQSHSTMSEFAAQYNYVAAQAKRSGMSSTQALDATAWLSRMGFGSGRGGTNFADFLQRSYYGSSGAKADSAMKAAGLVQDGHSVFYDSKGNFVGIAQASAIMQDFYRRYGSDMNVINPIMTAIWGVQGGRVAGALASKGAVDQWNMIQQNQSSTADIGTMQKSMNMTLGGQWTQFKTTIDDLVQVFGQQLIPIFTTVLAKVNDVVGAVLKFALAHPELVKIAAVVATIAAAAALIVGPMLAVIGMIGMLSAGFAAVGGVVSGVLLVIPAILAAIAGAAYLIYENWDSIKPYLVTFWQDIQQAGSEFVTWYKTYLEPSVDAIGFKFAEVWQTIKDDTATIWPQISQTLQEDWQRCMPVVVFYLNFIWETIKYIFNSIGPVLKFIFDTIGNAIITIFDTVAGVVAVINDLLNGNFAKMQQDGKTWEAKILDDLKQLFAQGWEDLKSMVSTFAKEMAVYGANVASAFVSSFGSEMAFGLDKFLQQFAQDHPLIMQTPVGGVVNGILSSIQQPSSDSAAANYGVASHITPHAAGGIFNTPHLGLVAEAGAEAIIPLTNRSRGLQLWQQAGQALGVGGQTVINIYPLPHQSPTEIAQAAAREFGRQTQVRVRNSGMRVNRGSV